VHVSEVVGRRADDADALARIPHAVHGSILRGAVPAATETARFVVKALSCGGCARQTGGDDSTKGVPMSDQDRQVRSVEDLDLQRYLGLWYEIGRLPLRFEDDGARDVTAEYSLRDDGTVQVDNRCIDAEGEPTRALGQAEPDEEHAGRLRVSFLPEG